MNLGDLFERTFGPFFARHGFTVVQGSHFDDPRGSGVAYSNEDFRVSISAEPYLGDVITSVAICPPSGPDNLGWLSSRRVLSHLLGEDVSLPDLQSTASAIEKIYDLLREFFREDEGYSDRWHLLQAYGNPKWVFVAPRWSDSLAKPQNKIE